MKESVQNRSSGVFLKALAIGCMAASVFMLTSIPEAAQASTSGGATIYNTVKVTYESGTTTLFASDSVSVIVNTVPAAPTVTNPAGQTVVAGVIPSYSYIIKSNSNGTDTYNTSALVNAPTGMGAAASPSLTASFSLWGGIALGSGAGTITVPFGTTAGLTAGSSTVQIGVNQYTVSGIALGSAPSTNASGNLVPEVPATLTLTPIASAPVITSGSVAAGTQVGEFRSTVTLSFTTGTPTTAGADGSYASSFTITTTATPVVDFTTVDVITTVLSPLVTISKTVGSATAKPGDTIDYTITVTNTHATAAVTNVTVIDPVPAYTTYVANSTRLNGITVAGDSALSPLVAGLLVDADGSRAAGVAATGNLPGLGVAVITFQVTVD